MSGPTTPKQIRLCSQPDQETGMNQYIWLCGVLGWGGSTGLVWSLTLALSAKNENVVSLLTVAAFFFPISGYCWGLLNWSLTKELSQKTCSEVGKS